MGDWRSSFKRSRRDLEDIVPRVGYSSRAGLLEVGRGYDDRGAIGIRDYGSLAYDGGLTSSLRVPSSSLGLGLGGAGSVASYGAAGYGAIDDPALNARLASYDSGLAGRPSALGLNGAALKPENVLPADASATLFVDGLPTDCSRREAAHIFRPFIGYKEVRVVHKERASGEKVVLCFVDFADSKCAATALEALRGYKLDEKDLDSDSLNITFARSPGVRAGGPRARDRSPTRGRDRRR